jgi:hypothetical protein
MRRYLDKADRPVLKGDVPIAKVKEIAGLYHRHGAWTWFEDYAWFPEEHFVKGPLTVNDAPGFGWLFPVNLIRLPEREVSSPARRGPSIRRSLRRIFRK